MPRRACRLCLYRVGQIGMGATALVLLTLGCIRFLDRPFSTAMHGNPQGAISFGRALTHIVDPLPVAAVVVAVLLAVTPALVSGPIRQPLVAVVIAILLAMLLKEQAKYAFGRTWPETWVDGNPSWIGSGRFGFEPFHGGRGWASFPSGHMVLVTAPALIVGRLGRPGTVVAVLAVVAVAAGLLLANYHFLSDVVAGIILGGLCGLIAHRIIMALPMSRRSPSKAEPAR